MAWYKTGTVSGNNGSPTITGSGTLFNSNVSPGEMIRIGGVGYEIANVVSDTVLTLASNYLGANFTNQSFDVLPTQSFVRDLALNAANLLNTFGAVRDGIGQGMAPAGTLAAPGLRFSVDQDTGIYRPGENIFGIVAGGVERLRLDTVVRLMTSVRHEGAANGQNLVHQFLLNGNPMAIMGSDAGIFGGPAGDFGTYVYGSNSYYIATNGSKRVVVDGTGNVGIGTTSIPFRLSVRSENHQAIAIGNSDIATNYYVLGRDSSTGVCRTFGSQNGIAAWTWETPAGERMRLDGAGNLLVGTTSGSSHTFNKNVLQGSVICSFSSATTGANTLFINAVSNQGYSTANAGLYVGTAGNTGRSINAGGTLNATGADYAEYMRKALNCGTILKGDVCGINRDGELVRTWAEAVRFVIKSTDPNLVGGDSWAAHLDPRPEAPVYAAPAYDGPAEPQEPEAPAPFVAADVVVPAQPVRNEDEDDEAWVLRMAAHLVERGAALQAITASAEAEAASAAAQGRYAAALRQYQDDLAAYDAARREYDDVEAAATAAHDEAMREHTVALSAWEAELEHARQGVDRIAFCGQVPVNVDADTLAACKAALADGVAVYLVAVARGAGIGTTAVRETDMTLPQYMRRLGAVWAIRDDRPWLDVQHG